MPREAASAPGVSTLAALTGKAHRKVPSPRKRAAGARAAPELPAPSQGPAPRPAMGRVPGGTRCPAAELCCWEKAAQLCSVQLCSRKPRDAPMQNGDALTESKKKSLRSVLEV